MLGGGLALGGAILLGTAAQSGQIARGAALYVANCQTCHGGSEGGTLRDIPPRHNANGHTWHHQDCLIADIVLHGFADADRPADKPTMPAFKGQLTDAEVAAILVYMKSWWTEEQRQWQREVTRQVCT